jgi:hypothetical protein
VLGLAHRLHDELIAVAPAHERLRGDVLVVLGEVEPAAQQLKARASVVSRGQAELGFQRRAEQRAAVLVQPVSLDLDPGWRPLEVLTSATGIRRSSSRRARIALKPNTFPVIEAIMLVTDPSSNSSRG